MDSACGRLLADLLPPFEDSPSETSAAIEAVNQAVGGEDKIPPTSYLRLSIVLRTTRSSTLSSLYCPYIRKL
jgi:hypothetical protein